MTKKKQTGPWKAKTFSRFKAYATDRDCQGWTVMCGDDVVADFPEGHGWTKAQLKAYAKLTAAAPQMKSDIDNFLAAVDACEDRSESWNILCDFTHLFRQSQKMAEGKK